MPILTVTTRGQITPGRELLRHMNIGPGDKIIVEKLSGGRILVRAAPPKESTEINSETVPPRK